MNGTYRSSMWVNENQWTYIFLQWHQVLLSWPWISQNILLNCTRESCARKCFAWYSLTAYILFSQLHWSSAEVCWWQDAEGLKLVALAGVQVSTSSRSDAAASPPCGTPRRRGRRSWLKTPHFPPGLSGRRLVIPPVSRTPWSYCTARVHPQRSASNGAVSATSACICAVRLSRLAAQCSVSVTVQFALVLARCSVVYNHLDGDLYAAAWVSM